jgi:GMP synthase (glutamine-hydrolysing)
MPRRLADVKLLLIQIRAEKIAAVHERQCVLEMTGLDLTQLDSVNVTSVENVPAERYDAADAVMIGGSGSNSVANDDPFTPWLIDDVKRLVDREVPLLGSCWGHQFIARALGGEVIHDPVKGEVGVLEAHVTAAASDDPVFDHLPSAFPVLMGHHDRVVTLPPGAIEMAYSDLSRNQAFKMDGLPVYGTQFHTEMTPDQLVERLSQFRQYMPDDDEFEQMKSRIRPTTEASRILPRFLEMLCS